MADEILFKIVDEIDCLAEGGFVLAAVHQDGFRTEHLRHFGQQCCAAVTGKQVGGTAQKRVGGDTGKPVASAAFKTDDQLAGGNGLTLELRGIGGQFVEQPHARLHLVLYILRDEELDAVGVVFAEYLFELGDIVVFAAEAQHKHCARVRMANHRREELLRVFMVFAQLTASVGMNEAVDAVYAVTVSLLRHALERFGGSVDTADGIYNPDLVADADAPILADVAFKRRADEDDSCIPADRKGWS